MKNFLKKSLEEFLLKLIHNSLTQLFMILLEKCIRSIWRNRKLLWEFLMKSLEWFRNVILVQIFEGIILKKKLWKSFWRHRWKYYQLFRTRAYLNLKLHRVRAIYNEHGFLGVNDARPEGLKESFKKFKKCLSCMMDWNEINTIQFGSHIHKSFDFVAPCNVLVDSKLIVEETC